MTVSRSIYHRVPDEPRQHNAAGLTLADFTRPKGRKAKKTPTERTFGKEDAKMLTQLKAFFIPQLTEMFDVVKKQVEKTKVEVADFASEFAEQLTPELAMEAKEKTDAEMIPSTEQLKEIKEFITNKIKEMQAFPPKQVAQIIDEMETLQVKIFAKERELSSIRSQMTDVVKKAQAILLKKQQVLAEPTREDENAKRLTELKRPFIPKLRKISDAVEKQVEKAKDEAAFFTSVFAEQQTLEHPMEAKEKTEAEIIPAREELKIEELITNENEEMQAFSSEQVAQIREEMEPQEDKTFLQIVWAISSSFAEGVGWTALSLSFGLVEKILSQRC